MLEQALPSRGIARASVIAALLCALALAAASPFLVETLVERRLAAPENAALWALVGILGLAGFAVASMRPYWAVLVLVATYPITPLGDDTVSETWKIGASLLLAWAGAVSVVIGWPAFRRVLGTRIGKLLVAWSVLVTVGALFGIARGSSTHEILREFTMLQAWVFALPIAAHCRDPRRLRTLLVVFVASAVLSTLYYMSQLGDQIVYFRSDLGTSFLRLTFRQAHSFALILLLALLLTGQLRHRYLLLGLGAIAVLLGGLVLSLGRAEWLATMVGVLLMIGVAGRSRSGLRAGRTFLAAMVIGLGILVAQFALSDTALGEIGLNNVVSQILQPDAFDQSASARLDEYGPGFDAFLES